MTDKNKGTGMDGYRPVNEGYRPSKKEPPEYGYKPPQNENQSAPTGTPPKKP